MTEGLKEANKILRCAQFPHPPRKNLNPVEPFSKKLVWLDLIFLISVPLPDLRHFTQFLTSHSSAVTSCSIHPAAPVNETLLHWEHNTSHHCTHSACTVPITGMHFAPHKFTAPENYFFSKNLCTRKLVISLLKKIHPPQLTCFQ